jgi:hypothetical protein
MCGADFIKVQVNMNNFLYNASHNSLDIFGSLQQKFDAEVGIQYHSQSHCHVFSFCPYRAQIGYLFVSTRQ